MTPENFCYWLQGCLELNPDTAMSAQQVEMIRQHLNLVMEKKTPNYGLKTYIQNWPNGGGIDKHDISRLTC